MNNRLQDSNIGITGPASVRLNGRCVENLPIAEGVRAKGQMPSVYETDRQNKIAAIRARYPKGSVTYFESRVKECRENIVRVQDFRTGLQRQIGEYTSQLTMCEYRDKSIAELVDDPDHVAKIKTLKKQFPLYNVEKMKQQIVQFEEGCKSSDDVIKQEHDSIAELSEAIGRCKQRDMELKNFGV